MSNAQFCAYLRTFSLNVHNKSVGLTLYKRAYKIVMLSLQREHIPVGVGTPTAGLSPRVHCKNLSGHLTTIPWLSFITTLSSLSLDDTVVTHVISIGNWNLGDESVVTNDEPVINWQGFVVIYLR